MTGMKDQYFGVEVEMTGITREQAAQALRIISGRCPCTEVGSMTPGLSKTQKTKSGN